MFGEPSSTTVNVIERGTCPYDTTAKITLIIICILNVYFSLFMKLQNIGSTPDIQWSSCFASHYSPFFSFSPIPTNMQGTCLQMSSYYYMPHISYNVKQTIKLKVIIQTKTSQNFAWPVYKQTLYGAQVVFGNYSQHQDQSYASTTSNYYSLRFKLQNVLEGLYCFYFEILKLTLIITLLKTVLPIKFMIFL